MTLPAPLKEWHNKAAGGTPLSAEDLNEMEGLLELAFAEAAASARAASLPLADLNVASGVAQLGSDATVGGPGGSPLSPSVVNSSPQSIGTPRLTIGTVPPASPTNLDQWLSTSFADMRVSPSPNDRVQILKPTKAWEGTGIQEPLMWEDGTNWNLLYSSTGWGGGEAISGLGWATCPLASDPMVPANWTKYGSNPVLEKGQVVNGNKLLGQHFGSYTEGETTYLYAPDEAGNVQVASCASTPFTPSALTWHGTAALTGGSAINIRVFKVAAGSYVMFYTYATSVWHAGVATAASPLGPFTTQVAPITSLDPVVGGGATDGPFIQIEGNGVVGYYHATAAVGGVAVVPSDIFRATIPLADVAKDEWTKLDNGLPFITRVASYEIDQVADVFVATSPDGVQLVAWDSFDNKHEVSSITLCALSPVMKRYDGHSWREIIAQSPTATLHGEAGNEAYGMGALAYITPKPSASEGIENTAIGVRAMGLATTALGCEALGKEAMLNATSAQYAIGIGYKAAFSTISAVGNVAIGAHALFTNKTSNLCVAIGNNALYHNTAEANTAVGASALYQCSSGSYNCTIGMEAGQGITTATWSVAIGAYALAGPNNVNGGNTAVGAKAMFVSENGRYNTAIGKAALESLKGGSQNVAIGMGANATLTEAENTVAIGYNTVANANGAVAIGIDHTGVSASTTTQDAFVLGTVNHTVNVPGSASIGGAGKTLGFFGHAGGTQPVKPEATAAAIITALESIGIFA